MKLRYLRLPELLPLKDVDVVFGTDSVLGRKCAIRFIAGVNGSGKSRLMQALAEVFLRLEARHFPPFVVTLAYDLGDSEDNSDDARTICLHRPEGSPSEGVLVEMDRLPQGFQDWEHLASGNWEAHTLRDYVREVFQGKGNLPGSGSINGYVPQVLLSYTSGDTAPWNELFATSYAETEGAQDRLVGSNDEEYEERPPGWDQAQEWEFLRREEGYSFPPGDTAEAQTEGIIADDSKSQDSTRIGLYVPPEALDLAFCAVALRQAIDDWGEISGADEERFVKRIEDSTLHDQPMPGWRGVLNTVGFLWPLVMILKLKVRPEHLPEGRTLDALKRLNKVATDAVRGTGPDTGYRLFFDLRRPLPQETTTNVTAAALMEAIASRKEGEFEQVTALDLFTSLRKLQAEGVLEKATMALRKVRVPDVLLYDWLSDGERVLLGRTALFQLLAGTGDALALLDEPETHFNDVWKRQIVDIIDDSLRDDPSEALISTHSSITLTDVFDTEIILLHKYDGGSRAVNVRTPIRSFGASPTEIMLGIFGAPESVGQRAAEFLDLVLLVAAHPEYVQSIWSRDGNGAAIRDSDAFRHLKSSVQALPRYYGDDQELEDRLLYTLRSVRRYAQDTFGRPQVDVADVVDALQSKLGPGYYQFEFRRRLRALRES